MKRSTGFLGVGIIGAMQQVGYEVNRLFASVEEGF